jgi:integrase
LIMEKTGIAQMWLERPTTALKLGIYLNAVFALALVRHNLPYNPAAWKDIKKLLPRKLHRTEHHVALRSHTDLPRFMARLRAHRSQGSADFGMYPTTALYVEMVVLTGVRQSEARLAQWKEIDWDEKNWHVPPEHRKLKEGSPQKIRTVPITKPMLAILEEMQRRHPDHTKDDLIFPSQGGRPFSENRASCFVNGQLGWETKVDVHGFRNMLEDWGHANGKEQYLIQRQFDHAVKGAVPKAYSAVSRIESDDPTLEPRRKMMEEYAAYCIPPEPVADNKVVQLRKAQ